MKAVDNFLFVVHTHTPFTLPLSLKPVQMWLFHYELADTLCVFCANDIHILSSKKKIEFLRPLEAALAKRGDLPNLILYMRNKADNDDENFSGIAQAIKRSKTVRM